jgi:hypothetical protein
MKFKMLLTITKVIESDTNLYGFGVTLEEAAKLVQESVDIFELLESGDNPISSTVEVIEED